MAKRLVFPSGGRVECENFETRHLSTNDVYVRTHYSLISTGTETIVYNRVFDPGTHWDNWIKYPFYPGYSAVGEIAEVGSGVKQFKIGDMVVVRAAHASSLVVTADECTLLPKEIDPKDAVWFALAKIGAMGAKRAEYNLGDSVLIIGAGPIGQMSLRWANAAGAGNIIVIDRVEKRLKMAKLGGGSHTIAKPVSEAIEDIKESNSGELPKIVVDTTGHPDVFASALNATALLGRVVLLGDTGMPAKQHLTPDVITKGLTIVGAHDSLEDENWNSKIIIRTFFDLVKSGRFNIKGLNTHEFEPEDCKSAYDLAANNRDETMGILFNWMK
jgi:2-desacetyl-2-hydroxyethyl bacteriochlorophyllide A dehydrogenase